jgi:hypothetical protein
LFELGSFISDDLNEELVFETLRGDSEVDQGDLDTNFWQVMGVSQLGGNNKLEVIVVGNEGVTEFNRPLTLDLDNRLGQHGFKRGVKLLFNVFE